MACVAVAQAPTYNLNATNNGQSITITSEGAFLYDDGGNDFVCDTSTPLGAVYYVPLDGGCERSAMLCESLQEFLDSIEVRLPGSW